MNEACDAGQKMVNPNRGLIGSAGGIHNPTVRENIEAKVAMLQQQIDKLNASKETLGPLLDMRINDLRDAMSY